MATAIGVSVSGKLRPPLTTFAQTPDDSDYSIGQLIHIVQSITPAEGKTDGRTRLGSASSHREQDVRRLNRPAAAGRAGGNSEAGCIERDQHRLARDTPEQNVAGIRQAVLCMRIDLDIVQCFEKLALEAVAQRTELMRWILSEQFAGTSERHYPGYALGSGPASAFVPAPELNRADRRVFAHEQGADALRPVNLVRADRVQIDSEPFEIHGYFPECLHTVRVEINLLAGRASGSHDFGDFTNTLYRTGLVVGMHDRNQHGLLADGGIDLAG